MSISINKEKLKAPSISLIYDKDFRPCYWKHVFPTGLKAEIVAGISEDIGEDGGWYIFCNDRLILGPDTTEITGWTGGRGKGGKELPKYHDQFFRFRGYVLFDAKDSSLLPWNTSKTGMNVDSPDFLHVKSQMIIMGKQVKNLMDDMKKERERENPSDNQKLNNAVKKATVLDVNKIFTIKSKLPPVYTYPKQLLSPAAKKEERIAFSKPSRKVKKAIEHFSAKTKNDAGSLAFDYFYENEIEDN